MADGPPTIEPALAPAAVALDQRALAPAQQVTPPLPAPGAAKCTIFEDNSHFDFRWFELRIERTGVEHFNKLLKEHNDRLFDLGVMRDSIIAHADRELKDENAPTNFLATIVALYEEIVSNGPRPAGVTNTYVRLNASEMLERLRNSHGNAACYGPFTAWWAGIFEVAGGYQGYNLHVWDETFERITMGANGNFSQHIQAVTQVDYAIAPKGARPGDALLANSPWFVTADAAFANPELLQYANLAINVWSQDHKATGYVIKELEKPGKEQCQPHVGFFIEPDLLLWILITEDRNTTKAVGTSLKLDMYLEAGYPKPGNTGIYNIRGANVADGAVWTSTSSIAFQKKFTNANQLKTSYRQIPHFRDVDSFKCARSQGQLDHLPASLMDEIAKQAEASSAAAQRLRAAKP